MRKIAVLDAETDPFKKGRVPEPFLWGFYDGEEYTEFTDLLAFVRHIYDRRIIVYAHNGGKFDYHLGLTDFIDPYSPVTIINGRIAKFKIGDCEFRDSYNIIPVPLATFNKEVIDYAIFEKEERDKPHNKKAISFYLMKDCHYLYELVFRFRERFGMNLTQAGASMKQWQKISGRTPPHDYDGVIYEAFKRFYYGGRCEAREFGVIEDDFKMVDIRSAYPYAMLSKHPIGLDYISVGACHDIHVIPGDVRGSAFFRVRCVAGGCFPFREGNSLFFPNDGIERIYDVTGWELIAGIETGAISEYEIIECFVFNELTDFSSYINHFYDERQKAKDIGDKAGDIFAKLFMNSLYGKFGSNPDEYKNYMVVEPDVFDKDGFILGEDDKLWSFGGEFGAYALAEQPLDDEEQRYYNVATAASITGFVRAYLWRASCGCDGVVYLDTDSITARDVKNLPNGIGEKLGQWSVDGEFSAVAIAGRKLYSFTYKKGTEPIDKKTGKKARYKFASKGTRLKPNAIRRVALGKIVIYEPEAPTFSVHQSPRFVNRKVKMVKKQLSVKEITDIMLINPSADLDEIIFNEND